jgi:hypothetical protein
MKKIINMSFILIMGFSPYVAHAGLMGCNGQGISCDYVNAGWVGSQGQRCSPGGCSGEVQACSYIKASYPSLMEICPKQGGGGGTTGKSTTGAGTTFEDTTGRTTVDDNTTVSNTGTTTTGIGGGTTLNDDSDDQGGSAVSFKLKLYLSAPWSKIPSMSIDSPNTGFMSHALSFRGAIPSIPQYRFMPAYKYIDDTSVPVDSKGLIEQSIYIVDWILVTLKDADNKVISKRSFLLKSDGEVVDPQSLSRDLEMEVSPAQLAKNQFRLQISHSAHLPVITKVMPISRGQELDLTSNNGAATLEMCTIIKKHQPCLVQLPTAQRSVIYALISGNINHDKIVNLAAQYGNDGMNFVIRYTSGLQSAVFYSVADGMDGDGDGVVTSKIPSGRNFGFSNDYEHLYRGIHLHPACKSYSTIPSLQAQCVIQGSTFISY